MIKNDHLEYYKSQIRFGYKKTDYDLGDVKIGEGVDCLNLVALFERARGAKFYVNQAGELCPIATFRERIAFWWDRENQRAKVKEAIDKTLKAFDQYLFFNQGSKNYKILKKAARALFNKEDYYGIGRLSKALYNDKLIRGSNTLSKYLLPKNTVRLKFGEAGSIDLKIQTIKSNCIDYDLGDAELNHNFLKLLSRKKGEKLHVINGKLRGNANPKLYLAHQKDREQEVKEAVGAVVQALESKVKNQEIAQKIHHVVIQRFFAEEGPLCRMSKATFDPSVIKEGSEIEGHLFEILKERRKEFADSLKGYRDSDDKNLSKKMLERAFLDFTRAEFNFAQRFFKLELVSGGGSGGARFAFDRFGNKIYVIKPGDEGQNGTNNPQWYARFKRWVMKPKACLEGNSEPLAELESWLWDRNFDIWSVPPTDVHVVKSSDFVGKEEKTCSLQMFVKTDKTLGDLIGVSPREHWLPRPYLRWICGSQEDLGIFSLMRAKTDKNKELTDKIPQDLMEGIAIQNMGTGDIDCQFANLLGLEFDPPNKEHVLTRLFGGEKVEDKEIDTLVENFFETKGNQLLLQHLLTSKVRESDGKHVALIKIDGGATHPRSHPAYGDYLSVRYKHLFEVLPHCEKPFSDYGKSLIANRDENFAQFLMELGVREFRGILTKEEFKNFWKFEANRKFFKEWIFERKPDEEKKKRDLLVESLKSIIIKRLKSAGSAKYYAKYHLNRIRGKMQTRKDSYRILKKHVPTNEKMRTPLKNVRNSRDFARELPNAPSLKDLLDKWKNRGVKNGEIKENEFPKESLTRNFIFTSLGEH